MNKSIFHAIDEEIQELRSIPSNSFNHNPEELEFKFGTSISGLYDVLNELFTSLSLIADDSDSKSDTKFKFIVSYPDEIYDDYDNIITYSLVRRTPFIADSKAISNGATRYLKPRFIKDKYNSITGNVEELYAAVFNNVISITCFSNKAKTLNNMSRLIESVFYKYSSYINKHVDQWSYIGMGPIQFINKYDQQERLFFRELQFNIVTSEFFITEEEQIKSIDIKKQTN